MADIISRATTLAKNGHTPGPWVPSKNGYVGSVAGDMICKGEILGRNEADTSLIAFAPEAALALAEEKFVYSVQVFMSGRWIFMVTLNTGNSLEEAVKWFPTKKRAEYFASLWEPDTPARVVKRRVSPVVVDG